MDRIEEDLLGIEVTCAKLYDKLIYLLIDWYNNVHGVSAGQIINKNKEARNSFFK